MTSDDQKTSKGSNRKAGKLPSKVLKLIIAPIIEPRPLPRLNLPPKNNEENHITDSSDDFNDEKNIQMENEKFKNIRNTIQQTVLPLVQAIYIEEPSDVNQFCRQYFENLVRDGNANEKIADGSINKAAEVSTQLEEDHCMVERNDDCLTATSTSSSIQGSASLPVLINDKLLDCLPARETSSWDKPRKNVQRNGSRSIQECSLADVLSHIGDQTNLAEHSECPKIEMKSGDASSTVKNEENSEVKNQNSIEENNFHQTEQDLEEDSRSCVFPSAPLQENYDKSLINIKSYTLQNPQVTSKSLVEYSDESSFSYDDENENEKVSNQLNGFLSESKSGYNTELEKYEVKKCKGQLSPSSSFGFIPHLQEHRSPDRITTQFNSPEDNCIKPRSAIEAVTLTKDMSETFQGLANKLNFAECNLNSEIIKANEISDVVLGSKSPDSFDDSKLTNSEINTNCKATKSTEEPTNDENDLLDDMDRYSCNRNEAVRDTKGEFDQIPLESIKMLHMSEETTDSCDCISDSHNQREDMKNETNTNLQKFTTGYKHLNIKSEHDKEENDVEKIDPTFSRNITEEENTSKNNQTQSFVDESWRKRWYEFHPCLDNIPISFRQRFPRRAAHPLNESNRISRAVPGIGEAGDVPQDPRLRAVRNVPSGRLESHSESTLEMSSTPSTFEECSNLYSSLSADEIYSKMRSGRVACNFDNRSSIHSRSRVSLRNIPYSWRNMATKQPASLAQNVEQMLIDTDLKSRHEVGNSEIPSDLNLTGHDSTDDEFVEIDDPVCKYFEHDNNKYSLKSEEDVSDNEYEECILSANYQENITEGYTALQENDFITEDWEDENKHNMDIEHTEMSVEEFENLMFESQVENCVRERESNDSIQSQTYSQEVTYNQNELTECYEMKKNSHCSECKEKSETKMSDSNIKSERGDDKTSFPNPSRTVKIEPGLNSACGDFANTDNNENNQQEFILNPSSFTPGYLTNLAQAGQSSMRTDTAGITQEEFEDVMRNVLNQQGVYPDDGHIAVLEGFQESDSSNFGSSNASEDDDAHY